MSTVSPRLNWIGSRVMRNRRVDSSLHTASRRIIDLLISEGIGTLVIGKNPLWKQEVQLGKRNTRAARAHPSCAVYRSVDLQSETGRDPGDPPRRELYQSSKL